MCACTHMCVCVCEAEIKRSHIHSHLLRPYPDGKNRWSVMSRLVSCVHFALLANLSFFCGAVVVASVPVATAHPMSPCSLHLQHVCLQGDGSTRLCLTMTTSRTIQ